MQSEEIIFNILHLRASLIASRNPVKNCIRKSDIWQNGRVRRGGGRDSSIPLWYYDRTPYSKQKSNATPDVINGHRQQADRHRTWEWSLHAQFGSPSLLLHTALQA